MRSSDWSSDVCSSDLRFQIKARIAFTARQAGGDRAEIRLRGQARHCIERAVDGVATRLDRGEHAGRGDAAGVVRVEMDRQANFLLEHAHQFARRARLADRKSTRLNSVNNAPLVCRLLLEKKNKQKS